MVNVNSSTPGTFRELRAVASRAVSILVATGLGLLVLASQAAAASKRPASVVAGSVSGGGNVKVAVVGTGKSSKTNAAGFFVLSGKTLAGKHRVVFIKNRKTFSTTIRVPAGSKVSLQNTRLNSDGSAQAEQEDIEVAGTLSAVSCSVSPNTVTIAPSDGGVPVTMSFDATTAEIVDDATDIKITDCNTLAGNYLNASAKAEGTQAADGSIVADSIELNPGAGQGGGGGGTEDIHFKGIVQTENCPSSIVVQRSDSTSVTVNLSASTEVNIDSSDSHSSAQCSDIPQGAKVDVEGVPQADGSVNALQIEVRQNRMESDGTIDSLSCDTNPPSFSFTPDSAASALTVTIGPTTQIEVGASDSASCADLMTGPAKVEGVTQSDGSLAASEIEQEAGDDGGGGGDGGRD